MVGLGYIMDAARSVTTAAIDNGEKPAVPAAILKYHVTEMGRRVGNDAMDIQGGKGIMLGPNNYLGRGYQSIPIAITVEGANILTRNLIIFGQGAIRCHPFVLREMNAVRDADRRRGVAEFDRALFGHIGFTISNAVRSLLMALSLARLHRVPESGPDPALLPAHRALQCLVRVRHRCRDADAGRIPEEEGDHLGAPRRRAVDDVPGLDGAQAPRQPRVSPPRSCRSSNGPAASCCIRPRSSCTACCAISPTAPLAAMMRLLIFPRGLTYFAPADRLGRRVADLVLNNTATRALLCRLVYRTAEPGNPLGALQQALELRHGSRAAGAQAAGRGPEDRAR